MKLAAAVCVISLMWGASSLQAANLKSEEAAIRTAIASPRMKATEDEIFWSGAYKRPVVRPEKGEEFSNAETGKRTNVKSATDVQRIEVAASGDLAYEFSYGSLEYDLAGPPPLHVAFKTGLLRVWKKVDGSWQVAAYFVRPLDLPFADPATAAAK